MTTRIALIAHDHKKDDIVKLAGEYVDTLRWLTNLKGRPIHKIGGSQPFERRSVVGQSSKYCLAVLPVRANEQIQIFCCSGFRVRAESITADHQIFNGLSVECA